MYSKKLSKVSSRVHRSCTGVQASFTHSPAVEGWESPNSDDRRKGLALCLLCADKVPFQQKSRLSLPEKSGQIRAQFYDDVISQCFSRRAKLIRLQGNKMVASIQLIVLKVWNIFEKHFAYTPLYEQYAKFFVTQEIGELGICEVSCNIPFRHRHK